MSHKLTGDVALRWIVTALFGVGIAPYSYAFVAQRNRWTSAVNHLLHPTMSAAMVLTAWRAGMDLPRGGPIIFFPLAWRPCGLRARPTFLRPNHQPLLRRDDAGHGVDVRGHGRGLPERTGHTPDHALAGSMPMNSSGMRIDSFQVEINLIATFGFAVVALQCEFCWHPDVLAAAGRHPRRAAQ
jgi:hypothetical protein